MSLTKKHCAETILKWGEYFVKTAERRLADAHTALTREHVQISIDNAREQERKAADPYYGIGWGMPSADQQHEETLKRLTLAAEEAARVLDNNKIMLAYIKDITENDRT